MVELNENTANGARIIPVTIDYRIPMDDLVNECKFESNSFDRSNDRFKYYNPFGSQIEDRDSEEVDFLIEDDCTWYGSGNPIFNRHRHTTNRRTHVRVAFENVRGANLREYLSLISQHPYLLKEGSMSVTIPLWAPTDIPVEYRIYPFATIKNENERHLLSITGGALEHSIKDSRVNLVGRILPYK